MEKDSLPVRCLLWGSGSGFLNNYYLIKYYELLGGLTVWGVTSNNPIHNEIGGWSLIEKKDIDRKEFDRVIIMSSSDETVDDICQEAYSYGINDCDIIRIDVMRLLGFDFYKYKMIKENPPTILAPNCWGGVTYNRLGLRFDSPFINMFEDHDDYIKLLENPRYYLEIPLKFATTVYNGKRHFPVAKCADIQLFFNHYDTFEEASDCWERRKKRIKWDNLFVMMYSEDPQIVDRFCKLPYQNKICFAPFESDEDCVATIKYPLNSITEKIPFGDIVNGMATGKWVYYNVFDLLLYNKITPVAGFKQS